MERQKIITVLVALFIGLIVGLYLGFTFAPREGGLLEKQLSSKTITSIIAYGKVASINGQTITIDNLGSSLALQVSDKTQVFAFKDSKSGPVQKTVSFSELKSGNSVNATLFLDSGKLSCSSVVILPESK